MKAIKLFLPLLILACNSTPNTKSQSSITKKSDTPFVSPVLTELYTHDKIPTQSFSIDAEKAFSITGKKGTIIIGKANCFVDANKQAVTGKIDLQLKEAYHISDFVKGNLTTLHNGKPLESGGMLNVLAFQNGKALQLKEDASLNISAPNFKKQKNMSLFEGIVAENSINWTNPVPIAPNADATESAAPKPVIVNMENGVVESTEILFPDETKARNIEPIPLRITKGTNQFLTDPSINFNFSIKKMGWANIDRLLSNSRTRPVYIKTRIANDSFKDVYIFMAIPNCNVYLPGYRKADNSFGFSHNDAEQQKLPVGEKVFIITTASLNGNYYFSMESFTLKEIDNYFVTLNKTNKDEVMRLINERLK